MAVIKYTFFWWGDFCSIVPNFKQIPKLTVLAVTKYLCDNKSEVLRFYYKLVAFNGVSVNSMAVCTRTGGFYYKFIRTDSSSLVWC